MTFDPEGQGPNNVHQHVEDVIEENEIVLFMKGTGMMPQCGYSRQAYGLISKYRSDVETVDVLPVLDEFRVALEERSGWTTIPQAFVEGEFIGGADILTELDERGELAESVNGEKTEAPF